MMEFEEEHEEEEEEEEEEDEEMAVTPTSFKASSGDKKPGTAGMAVRYRECLKNHAVGIGGHAVDGCGEFMPAGPEGSLDALKCAACNCHRNFHRKELLPPPDPHNQLALYSPRPHHPIHHFPGPPPQVYNFYPYTRTTPGPGPGHGAGYLHVSTPQQQQQRPLALPSPTTAAGGGEHERGGGMMMETTGMGMGIGMGMGTPTTTSSSGKKRFRTKFTQEQKDKMLGLAERLGWRIQKQDEEVVQQFCQETGVKRHVLKVWMHNNKHTLGKKP